MARSANVLLVLGVNAVAALRPVHPRPARACSRALLVKVFGSGATVAAYSVGQQIAIAALTFAIGLASVIWIFEFRLFKEVIARGSSAQREAEKAEKSRRRPGRDPHGRELPLPPADQVRGAFLDTARCRASRT